MSRARVLAIGDTHVGMKRTHNEDTFMLADEDNLIIESMAMYSDLGVPVPRPFHPRVSEAQAIVDDMASLFLFNQATLSEVMENGKELIAALDED